MHLRAAQRATQNTPSRTKNRRAHTATPQTPRTTSENFTHEQNEKNSSAQDSINLEKLLRDRINRENFLRARREAAKVNSNGLGQRRSKSISSIPSSSSEEVSPREGFLRDVAEEPDQRRSKSSSSISSSSSEEVSPREGFLRDVAEEPDQRRSRSSSSISSSSSEEVNPREELKIKFAEQDDQRRSRSSSSISSSSSEEVNPRDKFSRDVAKEAGYKRTSLISFMLSKYYYELEDKEVIDDLEIFGRLFNPESSSSSKNNQDLSELYKASYHIYKQIKEYTFHIDLLTGKLSREAFRKFIVADLYYVIQYAEAWKELSYRTEDEVRKKLYYRKFESGNKVAEQIKKEFMVEYELFEISSVDNHIKIDAIQTYIAHIMHAVQNLSEAEALASLIPCCELFCGIYNDMVKEGKEINPKYKSWIELMYVRPSSSLEPLKKELSKLYNEADDNLRSSIEECWVKSFSLEFKLIEACEDKIMIEAPSKNEKESDILSIGSILQKNEMTYRAEEDDIVVEEQSILYISSLTQRGKQIVSSSCAIL